MFLNYQYEKLDVANPALVNLLILGLFSFLVAVSLRKRSSTRAESLLAVGQTEQLKGLAIFLVVLGHVWTHVSQSTTWLVLSGEAVSLFLLLSGFGLTLSMQRRSSSTSDFWLKRIRKVMIPYWIATAILLVLNYLILRQHLPLAGIALTIFGINAGIELRHIDYVRWFVTFILLWYTIFFAANAWMRRRLTAVCSMVVIAFVLLPLNYYVLDVGWYQFFSFPVGCLLGLYHDRLQELVYTRHGTFLSGAIIGAGYVLAYKFVMADEDIYLAVTRRMPTIVLAYLREFNSLVLNGAIIVTFWRLSEKGYRSRLLQFLGKYSYEIFLLHGAFLVKYNLTIKDTGALAVIGEFVLYLSLVVALALALSFVSGQASARLASWSVARRHVLNASTTVSRNQ